MLSEFNSLSIKDIIWIEFKKNRISFSWKGLPIGIHFTLSLHEDNPNANFHLTKNVGDGTNKPKIVIALVDKTLFSQIISIVSDSLFSAIYQTISFKAYSRKSRRNIRLIYLDEMERSKNGMKIKEDLTTFFEKHAEVKKGQLRISTDLEKSLLPVVDSPEMRSFILNAIRPFPRGGFKSTIPRSGILFMGKKQMPFLSVAGKCLTVKRSITIRDLLLSCMKPELVNGLFAQITEALQKIQAAETYHHTLSLNNPYQLVIEER